MYGTEERLDFNVLSKFAKYRMLIIMEAVILYSDSKSDVKLLLDLAKKIGIKARIITESEIEQIGLANAIKQGVTNEYVDNEALLKKL